MATIETKKVQFDQLVVHDNNNIADVNDVINVLTVMTSSEKRLNYIDKPEATNYLKAAGLISEREPKMFAVEDMDGCKSLNDQLSNSITKLIEEYGKGLDPDVMFNSASAAPQEEQPVQQVEEQK